MHCTSWFLYNWYTQWTSCWSKIVFWQNSRVYLSNNKNEVRLFASKWFHKCQMFWNNLIAISRYVVTNAITTLYQWVHCLEEVSLHKSWSSFSQRNLGTQSRQWSDYDMATRDSICDHLLLSTHNRTQEE